MPSQIDLRRLRDGATAMALPEPKSQSEIAHQLPILHDGIAALQSTDDLGSPEANKAAWDDMLALQAKYNRLKDNFSEY